MTHKINLSAEELQEEVTIRLKNVIDPDYYIYDDADEDEDFGVDECDLEVVDSEDSAGWSDVLLTGSLWDMLTSEKEVVRVAIAEAGLALDILVKDPSEEVREAVARQGYGVDELVNDPSFRVRRALVHGGYALDILVKDPNPLVRAAMASCGHEIETLKNDPVSTVRFAALNYERESKAKTSTRFINDDIKVDTHLNASEISKEELKEIVLKAALMNDWVKDNLENWGKDSRQFLRAAVMTVFRTLGDDNIYRLTDDVYAVSEESFGHYYELAENHLLGLRTLENGVSFWGFLTDNNVWNVGDPGTFAVLYHDGKRIRLYTPVCGNDINTYMMTSLGMEAHVICKNDFAAYQKVYDEGLAHEMCDAYLAEYDLVRDTVAHNWDAIKDELERVFR